MQKVPLYLVMLPRVNAGVPKEGLHDGGLARICRPLERGPTVLQVVNGGDGATENPRMLRHEAQRSGARRAHIILDPTDMNPGVNRRQDQCRHKQTQGVGLP